MRLFIFYILFFVFLRLYLSPLNSTNHYKYLINDGDTKIETFNFFGSSTSSLTILFAVHKDSMDSIRLLIVFHSSENFCDSLGEAFVCQFAGQRSMVWLLVKSHHDRRLFLSMRLIDQRRDGMPVARYAMKRLDSCHLCIRGLDFRNQFLPSRLLTVFLWL